MILSLLMLCAFHSGVLHAQALETEESKPLLSGQFELGTGLEYQISTEGNESALPMAIEFGISKRLTLLVEPVAFTTISPKIGNSTTDFGDLEATLFFQIAKEKKVMPSVSISGEVKFPITHNPLIGTGKIDYSPYLIASKTTGKFFTSINFSYTILGKPSGAQIQNIFGYAAGTIFKLSKKNILFGEVYGNTSALIGGETPEGQIPLTSSTIQISELTGGETVGAIGYGFYLKKELFFSIGINYDNNAALLIRPGIEWKFGGNGKAKP